MAALLTLQAAFDNNNMASYTKCTKICWGLVLLFALFNSSSDASGAIVKSLPGFPGEIPFVLQTGYVSVNDSELFYYFIESQGNPQEDPLFLWLTGGPGCSSFCGILYEIGPLELDIHNYIGGLPKLLYYPYAWTKTASIIFLDSPVGTGFSYSRTEQSWQTSDSESTDQAYQFLIKWLDENPKYLLNQLFIGGDSYSGIIVPLVTKKIVEGNEAGLQPHLNLKGYLLGSPTTDEFLNSNSKISFAHRMALISDKLYEKLKSSCNENYVDIDPSNVKCLMAIAQYEKCVEDINTNAILEPNCVFASPHHYEDTRQRATKEKESSSDFIFSLPRIPELWCRNFNYVLLHIWANDDSVQEALHVRKGTVKEWTRCNLSLSYTQDVQNVIQVHKWLSKKNLHLLVESGDHDMVVPFVATNTWIKILNITLDYEWRPWSVDGQVAGYTKGYSDNGFLMTYVTVKGGGHTAPEYYRKECYEMFQRWIHNYPV